MFTNSKIPRPKTGYLADHSNLKVIGQFNFNKLMKGFNLNWIKDYFTNKKG